MPPTTPPPRRLAARLVPLLTLATALLAFLVTRPANRHVLLRVPRVGWILHTIAGGVVPPYMVRDVWARHEDWLKANDVVISVPAKSGTTWTMSTVNEIRLRGQGSDTRDIFQDVPWADFVHFPGQTLEERVAMYNATRAQGGGRGRERPFRAFKTHQYPPTLPLRADVRYIVVVRPVADAVASFSTFLKAHDADFARMWGGFPVLDQSMAEYEHWILKDIGDGTKPALRELFTDFVKAWWPLRHEPNVLFLHYADRLADPVRDVRRIAEFLGVDLTPDEVQRVVERTSFAHMKKTEHRFLACSPLVDAVARGLYPDKKHACLLLSGAMLQKGKDRRAEEQLSRGFIEKVRAMAKAELDEMGDERAFAWTEGGGEVPP